MRKLFRLPIRRRVARDLDLELRFHLEMQAEELRRQGMTSDDAMAEARRRFGDLEDARRFCAETDTRLEDRRMRTEFLAEVRQDLAFGLRTLRRTPAFSLVAALTLAIGIGANTAIFSVVRGIILRPLPFAEPDRVVLVTSEYRGRRFPFTSPANAADWKARSRSFTSLAVSGGRSAVLTDAGEPEEIDGAEVSADLFSILGLRPVAGRLAFNEEEAAWRGPNAVILSETLWRSRFGADPAAVGTMITLDGERHRVIGVAPAASWPVGAMVWYPFRMDPEALPKSRGAVYLGVIGRLREGVTLEAAHREMQGIAGDLEREYPDANEEMGAAVVSLHEWVVGSLRRPLLLLLGGVGFVLLIACANVANLMLVRGMTRRGELAVRAALGAGRSRLRRQLGTEALILATVGAALGLLVAFVVVRLIVAKAPAIPLIDEVRVDGLVLGFTIGITLLANFASGLLPARQLARLDLVTALRTAGRSGSGGGTERTRKALVVAEVALAVVLLAGAGLLIRSFARLTGVDPGFRPDGVVSFAVSFPDARYPTGDRRAAAVAQVVERLRALPGVTAADAVTGLPLTSHRFGFSFAVTGRPTPASTSEQSAEVKVATPGYFATMGIPVVKGRALGPEDRRGAPASLLANETAVRRFFPNEDPIGKHLTFGWRGEQGNLEGTIVGVVGDVKQNDLSRPTMPEFWVGVDQWPVSSLRMVIRTDRPAVAVAADAGRVIHAIDPALAINQVKTLGQVFSESVAVPRFYMLLLSAFAAVAIFLSAIGIYGVTAYLVGQRHREIGIRMALGASREGIVRMVLREGAGMALAGLGIGLIGAVLLTRLMTALLFGVGATDPLTYFGVTVVLGGAALLACWGPARRAARVEPSSTMRAD